VAAAERLQVALGLPGNGFSPHLRSKYAVNEALRKEGLEITRQFLAANWASAVDFIDDVLPKKSFVVVKPARGVASDGVFLCGNKDEAKRAFDELIGKNTYGGGTNDHVLIQEFADGTEYAVDSVSHDGVTKVLAVWKYSKVSVNDAPFVYQCTELLSYSNPEEEEEVGTVSEYVVKALQAVNLRYGPSHTELKKTTNGLRLIEINPR
jgi:biotin carboxylase